jgi:nucleoside-specific outer membrane channel protein Tsx
MSRKLRASVVMAGLVLASSSAFAAAQMTSGEVKSIDAPKHHLVLSSGETFGLAKGIDATKLKTGDKVTFDMKNGKMRASKVDVVN